VNGYDLFDHFIFLFHFNLRKHKAGATGAFDEAAFSFAASTAAARLDSPASIEFDDTPII